MSCRTRQGGAMQAGHERGELVRPSHHRPAREPPALAARMGCQRRARSPSKSASRAAKPLSPCSSHAGVHRRSAKATSRAQARFLLPPCHAPACTPALTWPHRRRPRPQTTLCHAQSMPCTFITPARCVTESSRNETGPTICAVAAGASAADLT